MAIVDVVKWNASPEVYAWKFPSEELGTWTQLIVSETQEAVLLRSGQMLGPFKPGRYTLSTENIPILTSFLKIAAGGRTPFTAEVWFVNRVATLDVKWGTSDPIQLSDPKYEVMLPIRAYGQFGIQVESTKKFLNKLVGTMPSFDRQQLVSYFRGLMLTRAKDLIANKIVREKISILEISAHLNEISQFLQNTMTEEFAEFGLKLQKFFVNSINTPEDDPAVVRLRETLAKKADMKILGYTWQQGRSFDTLEAAAANPGSASAAVMGAGMGVGMGVPMGAAMGGAMGAVAQNIQPTAMTPCPKCHATNLPDAKFCSSCGGPMKAGAGYAAESIVCHKCGASSPKASKFCSNCSNPFFLCAKCGADNAAGSLACAKCGAAMPLKCGGCGAQVPADTKFCPSCGKPLVSKCAKCNGTLPPTGKFCPNCGAPRA